MPETPHKHYTFEGFEMHFANHPPKPRAQGSSPCTPATLIVLRLSVFALFGGFFYFFHLCKPSITI